MREIEVKAWLRDRSGVIERLEEMGCIFGPGKSQKDVAFFPSNYEDGADSTGVNFLRLRRQDGKTILTLKRPVSGLDKYERETVVENEDAMRDIILSLGFRERSTVEKRRITTTYAGMEICIDDVTDLGSFIEVELMVEEGDGEKIQGEMFHFLKELGVEERDRVTRGYDLLIMDKQ